MWFETKQSDNLFSAMARNGNWVTEDEKQKIGIGMTLITILVFPFYFLLTCLFAVPEPFLIVSSGSMTPKYKIGDVILVCSPHWFGTRVKEGTVIVYRPNGNFNRIPIIHRVVGSTRYGLLTKGDANSLIDQDRRVKPRINPVREEQIIGKVLFKIPLPRRLSNITVDSYNGDIDGLKNKLKEMD